MAARALLALAAALLPAHLVAHSVGQRQTTKYMAPETVQMLVDRAGSGSPGLRAGDIVSYIIQFSPVANGATVGVAGYVTDYIPPNTEVVGASIVTPSGSGFVEVPPSLPGTIDNGWGGGASTFYGPFATHAFDSTGLCAKALRPADRCNGSLAQLHADTGIFFSTDARTTAFPAVPTRIEQGTNGYIVTPTGVNQLNDIVGNTTNATTHNAWDAAMTNAFGTTKPPGTSPSSSQPVLSSTGRSGAPFGAGSPVAGPQTGYPLDYTAMVGPWQRIAYSGSRIGSLVNGPAIDADSTFDNPALSEPRTIKGSPTSLGHALSPANPLPPNTNAVRWAVGGLLVGENKYVRISLRLLVDPPVAGIVNGSEVWGGDAAGADDGKDNPWRYHVPSVADNNSNLYVLKSVVCVYSGTTCVPGSGATVPASAKIRYRITYLNTGNLPQTNVVLRDILPVDTPNNSVSNVTVVSGPNILPFTPASPAGSGATITFQTIPLLGPGTGGAVELDVLTNGTAGDSIVNTARLSSTQIPLPGVTSSVVSAVQNSALLNIAKSVTPASISPGGTVTYTITVSNVGTAAANTIIVDEFLPSDDGAGGTDNAATRFNFVTGSSSFNGVTAVLPTVTTPADISPYIGLNRQRVTWSFGGQTLAAGASFTITFQATAGASVPTRTQPYTNDARVTYDKTSTLVSTVNTAPVLVLPPASLTHVKTVRVYSDPFNGQSFPKAIPGADMEYTLTVTNTGGGSVDNNTVSVADPIPTNTRLFLGDLGGAGSGPVAFVNGTPSSGLTWTYTSLGSGADDLEFFKTGPGWNHSPTPDSNGYDTSGTESIRMRPKGTMAGNTGSGNPSFQLRFRVRIN